MMYFDLNPDGSLGTGDQDPRPGRIEVDEVAPFRLGDRLVIDPDDPRRAIPDPGALEKRASAARLEAAIAAKQRQMALARLTIEDEYPGAAEAQTKLDAEIKALALVADLADDFPDEGVPKG